LYIVFIIFTFLQLPIGKGHLSIYFISYCADCAPVWFLYPETGGLTLEEIDTLFVKDHAVVDTLAEKAEHVRHLEGKHAGVTQSVDVA
jgi:hypothetical protein